MNKKEKKLRMYNTIGADRGRAWFSDVASITVFDSFQAHSWESYATFMPFWFKRLGVEACKAVDSTLKKKERKKLRMVNTI